MSEIAEKLHSIPIWRRKAIVAMIVVGLMTGFAASIWNPYGWVQQKEALADGKDHAGRSSAISPESLREQAALPSVALNLKKRLDEKPVDPDGWALLARTYSRLGRYQEAKDAFKKSLEYRPDDAGVLADYADTLAYLNNGNFTGEPQNAIDRALQLEPENPGALMLAGLAEFDSRNFRAAIAHWEKLQKLVKSDSARAAQVERAINAARKQLP